MDGEKAKGRQRSQRCELLHVVSRGENQTRDGDTERNDQLRHRKRVADENRRDSHPELRAVEGIDGTLRRYEATAADFVYAVPIKTTPYVPIPSLAIRAVTGDRHTQIPERILGKDASSELSGLIRLLPHEVL